MNRRTSLALCAIPLVLAAACGDDTASDAPQRDAGQSDARVVETDAAEQDDVATGEDAAATPDATGDAAPPDVAGCEPGTQRCDGTSAFLLCTDAREEERRSCDPGTSCVEATGECTPRVCEPNARECASAATIRTCSSDGQVWGEPESCGEGNVCEDGSCVPGGCLARVMFAVDGSGSMAGEWDAVRASINEVVSANPGVAFGLSMFPVGLGCSIGDGRGDFFTQPVDWPHVEIQEDAGPVIETWFDDTPIANGSTPLISTIEWFGDNARAVWGDDRRGAYLVVLSEGADTCRCDEGETACLVAGLGNATYDLLTAGVKTYVIGYRYGDAPGALEAIAENGGTALVDPVLAGDETGLIEAFGAILADAKACP